LAKLAMGRGKAAARQGHPDNRNIEQIIDYIRNSIHACSSKRSLRGWSPLRAGAFLGSEGKLSVTH
jgi:hypothetical protein